MQSNEWEAEKQDLFFAFKKRLINDKDQVEFGDLLNFDLPAFFKSFLKTQVRRFYEAERPINLNKSSRFNFDSEEVTKLISQLMHAIQNATLFSSKEIAEAIEKTIGLQIDFLVKPRQTLQQIFFKVKASMPYADILQAVIALSDNRPYMRHLIQILKNIHEKTISKNFFIRLLQEAEEEVYRQKPISAFIQDTSAVLEFFSQVKGEACNRIKRSLLTNMLRERNLINLAERFQAFSDRNSHGDEFIDLAEIEKILEGHLAHIELESASPKKMARDLKRQKDQVLEQIIRRAAQSKEEPAANHFLTDTNDLVEEEPELNERKKENLKKNWVLFGSNNSNVIGGNEIEEIEIKTPEPPSFKKPKIIYKEDQLPTRKSKTALSRLPDEEADVLTKRSKFTTQPIRSIPDLASLIDDRSRKMFIKKIYRKDEAAYQGFIAKLQTKMTWKEAKAAIDQELGSRGIEPFSREAIRLGDLVFGRYFPKKQ